MEQETKKRRGRPRKNQVVETNTQSSPTTENIVIDANTSDKIFEYNTFTYSSIWESFFNCGIYDCFDKNTIHKVLKDPVIYHDEAIRLSEFVYTKNGIVSNSIDYMVALPCLDSIVINKAKKKTTKSKAHRDLMKSTLKTIDDKSFIRNALFTEMLNGIAFFYFETKSRQYDKKKFLTDYEVDNIVEINELGINATIITLPWQYTKIVGKKNNRYVLAFNLRYFDDFTGESLEKKLRKYPEEISKAYSDRNKKRDSYGDWVILDNNKTLCRKIKCKDSEPWGRSLVLAALHDVLYKDYFTDTKRNVLDEVNNHIIYQTLPESERKGICALTKKQQEDQHNTVKRAISNKNNKGGISFFTVSAGTKLNSIEVDTDIFDSKNESDLTNQISVDLGICSSLIGAMSTGNFASGQSNLEMITAQLYTWVYEWQNELNFVINKNIIQDSKNPVEVYYFPTSFVNKQGFFDQMLKLYTTAGGSLKFLIASAGIDVESYLSVLDEEIDEGVFEKYLPHQTSFTMSGNGTNEGGRPKTTNPSENTIKSQMNNGNDLPSPSDNK